MAHADHQALEFADAFWPLFLKAYRAALRILHDRSAAEDVAADVLARLHMQWARIGRTSYREAWVVRVAINRALDIARRAPQAGVTTAPTTFEDEIASRVALVSELNELPRRQREVVALRYVVGLPVDEVARVLEIRPGTVRRHLDRGVRRLRGRLAGFTQGESE